MANKMMMMKKKEGEIGTANRTPVERHPRKSKLQGWWWDASSAGCEMFVGVLDR